MEGESDSKRMATSTVTSSNIIVSSQQVEVMSQSLQEFNVNGTDEFAVERERTDQSIQEVGGNGTVEVAVEHVKDGPIAERQVKETVANKSDVEPLTEMLCDKSGKMPIFHFTNCSDFKFTFGK